MLLEKLSGPVIGAVIGYCTNYIAVKMLFYPRKEIRIFGHKLPFTPGAIPKGKPRLAKAIGNIVANTLLTKEDIKEKILSSDAENAAVKKITAMLEVDLQTGFTGLCSSEESYENAKQKISDRLTDQVMESLRHIDVGNTIAQKSQGFITDKIKGTMLEMFVTEELIASFAQPMGQEINHYIEQNGETYIRDEISYKINALEKNSVMDLCTQMELQREMIEQTIAGLYHKVADGAVDDMISHMNIAEIIEDKIDQMRVEDLEKMVLSVMKKELDMIVNLGALVGAILGIFNMFF